MRNKLKKQLVLGLCVVSLFFVRDAKAEETRLEKALKEKTVSIQSADSRVGFSDAKIVNRSGGTFLINFKLKNSGKLENDLHYGLQLERKTDKGNYLVDEKVFSETVSLLSGQTIERTVSYVIPNFFSGNFQLWLVSKNSVGMSRGINFLGEIKLAGTNDFIEFPVECYLTINEENKKYQIKEGVSLKKGEKVFLNCQLENLSSKAITAQAWFEIYRRSIYGEREGNPLTLNQTVALNSGEKKFVKLEFPQLKTPQAYDIRTQLLYQGNPMSNFLTTHLVLSGESASILTFNPEKMSYKKGETGKFEVTWAGSADNFYGSRTGETISEELQLEVEIFDADGSACAKKTEQKVDGDGGKEAFSVPIIENCSAVGALVVLKNKAGRELDKKTFNLSGKTEVKSKKLTTKTVALLVAIAISVFSLIIIFIVRFMRKRRSDGLAE
jgi:hypothetical protein